MRGDHPDGPATVDEIPWDDPAGPPEPSIATSVPKKCRHPRDRRTRLEDGGWTCACGHTAVGAKVRGGRAIRKYGIQKERDAATRLGLERRGRVFDPEDLGGAADPAVVQVKTGPGFASAAWMRELDALEGVARNRPRILLALEKPGRGRVGRRLVVMLEDEFQRLTGLDARRKNLEALAEAVRMLERRAGDGATARLGAEWDAVVDALVVLQAETPAR